MKESLGGSPDGVRVEIVSGDGFLFPNRVLDARGLGMRKGFPESYDRDALLAFLDAVKAGERGIRVPLYSHEDYDVLDETQVLEAADVLIVEGLHLLGLSGAIDVGIYVDAAETDIEQWFVDRFLLLRGSGQSFYRQFAGFSDDEAAAFARQVWDGINAVNLHDYILPTRERADVVIEKASDHSIEADPPPAWKHAVVTDQELVDLLEEVWTSIETLGEDLQESEWKRHTELPGWTVQDNLVHLSAIESMSLGRPWRGHEATDLRHVKNDVGRSNEHAVDSRRGWSGAQALAEFHVLTTERIAKLRALDEAGFGGDSWTPVGPGTVRDLLPFRIFDSWVHEQDMRRAVRREGNLGSGAARLTQDMVVDAMPFVIGKKVAPPDGSTVVFSIGSPLPREVAIAVAGGRAALLERQSC